MTVWQHAIRISANHMIARLRCSTGFDKKIGSPDLAVVFTDTVSHKMLNGLNQRASKLDFPVAICHSSSCSALKNVLEKYCTKGVVNA